MRRAVLAVAGAAILWSTGGLFIKVAPMPALAVAGGRSLVAVLFYLAFLRPDLRAARWTTAAAYAGCIVTFVSATKLTTAANAIFLQYTGPAYVLVLSPFLLDEPFRPIDGICVALSLAGMSLFFVGKVESGQLLGNLLAIASGVFFALAVVLLRRDAKTGRGDALPSTTLGNFLAAALTAPCAAARAGPTAGGPAAPPSPPPRGTPRRAGGRPRPPTWAPLAPCRPALPGRPRTSAPAAPAAPVA